MKIQILSRKITENLGFEFLLQKVNFLFVLFSYNFQIFHTKLGIFDFNDLLICKTRYSKMVKNKDKQFFENEQKKDNNFFDLLDQGFEPQVFSNFPIHNLNFHGR